MGSQVERTCGKVASGGPGQVRWWLAEQVVPHVHAVKPGGTTEQLGTETDGATQGSSAGK